ncbi:putative ABC transporter ATP-binding protein YhcH [Streptomyces aurantiacus JA 4570]|uniref:Putative ABC transporter ATP-binding protein YhcH n=1 Tax=Streptomyces aurantiacus JA 4570 TaxID=1286094 RepID=S3ZP26_9ACTN|nr:putative ABC transporter ATP-binding protein YhcH [Streptomyces aurantiacus JA 4570]
MIEVKDLTKRYGATTAVQELSFTVRPGHVTGFLGPNGAGKSTTLRMILGLNAPTGGSVTVGGRPFRDRPRGLRHVGALLDAGDVHGGRSAVAHLAVLARGNRIPRPRVDEVLAEVGLAGAAGRRRIAGYSLGMRPCYLRCSATRRCCSSTNRSTGSTRKACCGCAACSGAWPPRAAPSSCPAI